MFHFTKKRAVVIAVIGSLALGAGAYAYFTSTGTGSGEATVGESTNFVIATQATEGGPMTPGGTGSAIETIHYTVTNNSTGHQNLANVDISVSDSGMTWTVGTPACTKDDFRIGGPTGPFAAFGVTYSDATVENIAPGQTVARTARIRMIDNGANQDACQGETPPLHLVAS